MDEPHDYQMIESSIKELMLCHRQHLWATKAPIHI